MQTVNVSFDNQNLQNPFAKQSHAPSHSPSSFLNLLKAETSGSSFVGSSSQGGFSGSLLNQKESAQGMIKSAGAVFLAGMSNSAISSDPAGRGGFSGSQMEFVSGRTLTGGVSAAGSAAENSIGVKNAAENSIGVKNAAAEDGGNSAGGSSVSRSSNISSDAKAEKAAAAEREDAAGKDTEMQKATDKAEISERTALKKGGAAGEEAGAVEDSGAADAGRTKEGAVYSRLKGSKSVELAAEDASAKIPFQTEDADEMSLAEGAAPKKTGTSGKKIGEKDSFGLGKKSKEISDNESALIGIGLDAVKASGAALKNASKARLAGKDASDDVTDVKGNSRKKTIVLGDKLAFEVTDLRSLAETQDVSEGRSASDKNSFAAAFKTQTRFDGSNMQFTFDLNQNQINPNMLTDRSSPAGSVNSNFQSMLSNLIQDKAAEFARAGSIVLKDNNFGNISMVLHPESLGNVKINLELADKIITGHITVNSREAMAAFEGNIQALKNAFMQSGFESASFDLSMANHNAGGNSGGGQGGQKHMQDISDKIYGDYAEVSSAAPEVQREYGIDYSVNIVA
ncbi:flagellar hook-length control protein FliK [Treponema parvum]|uniref:Flagellar hook-length control protein FliK n=1 Tax=Treponema parvum TaxID=138851 RepID=A0A975ICN0_9SPIR|nr:flagellar hook-length control protein FliK [Treponema parvum]QTQ12166.1 flagellar hook-length control protein FliK [Treponema parvum]QTQ15844.1 flagellar hook-length control protein FliK [Treponema parvum]